jgi:N-carbamoyl-L-amino-acid hydrolase
MKGLEGVTRLALSEEDGEARDLLVSWMREEGLTSSIIGNILGPRGV